MTQMRPTAILLRTGHQLTSAPGSLAWICEPPVPGRAGQSQGLRDVLDRVAVQAGTAEAYGCRPNAGFFAVVYAILAELREAHGQAFAWTRVETGDRSLLIIDELDDPCCESRVWARGGNLQPLVTQTVAGQPWTSRAEPSPEDHADGAAAVDRLIASHNHRIGFTAGGRPEPSVVTNEIVEDHIVVRMADRPVLAFKGPDGIGARERGFADYLASLAA